MTSPLGSRAVMRWGSSPHARTNLSRLLLSLLLLEMIVMPFEKEIRDTILAYCMRDLCKKYLKGLPLKTSCYLPK